MARPEHLRYMDSQRFTTVAFEEVLLELSRSQQKESQPQPLPQPLSTRYAEVDQRAQNVEISADDKLRIYLNNPLVLKEKAIEQLAMMTTFGTDFRKPSYDFPDDAWREKSRIKLVRCPDSCIAELGRQTLPMFTTGFTQQGAAAVFVLAYHLRAPSAGYCGYVFNVDPPFQQIHDAVSSSGSLSPSRDIKKEAAVYAYLAASALRLFTKPAESYVRAWNHIVSGYRKFYNEEINLHIPSPSETAMKGLSNYSGIDKRTKVSLYRLLYISNGSNSHQGLKRFLFDIHLANTGMQIVEILANLAKILNCTPETILAAVKSWETLKQVDSLAKVQDLMKSCEPCHQRRMWKYGRIFDETFMADLKPKSCPKLVYILAEALRCEDPVKHEGVLRISQLADVSLEDQKRCKVVAQRLLNITKAQSGNEAKFGQ